MKIGHFSDIHYAPETLEEVERCMGNAVARAKAEGIEVAVISGDATDHRLDVHSPAFIALARRVHELSLHCQVLMLQGTYSHEPPGTLTVFGLIGGRFPVLVADRISQAALMPDGSWLSSPGWRFESVPEGARLLVSLLPSLNKAAVAAAVGAEEASEAVGNAVTAVLAGFADINAEARSQGVPTIGVSHGTLNGCQTEHGVPMAGLDHEFTESSIFAAGCDAFMLGHIHKCQSWARPGQLIAYAGSLGRLHYGETDTKGWLLWDVEPGDPSAQQVPTPARRMVHLDFTGKPDMDAIRLAAADAKGAFVRVRWSVMEEERSSIDKEAIQAALADAAGVKLEGRIVPVVRSRVEGMGAANSLDDKITLWASTAGADAAPLLDRLAQLAAQTPEEIAAAVELGAGDGERPDGDEVTPSLDAQREAGVASKKITAAALEDLFA